MGMTLKAWKNYSIKQAELMQACEMEGRRYTEPLTEENEDDFVYYYEDDEDENSKGDEKSQDAVQEEPEELEEAEESEGSDKQGAKTLVEHPPSAMSVERQSTKSKSPGPAASKARKLTKYRYGSVWTDLRVTNELYSSDVKAKALELSSPHGPGSQRYVAAYWKAARLVYDTLSPEEQKEIHATVETWNAEGPPETIKRM